MSKSQRKVVESNFSALRRSLIHGDIPEAIALMKNGALLHQTDNDDHTALDQILSDRQPRFVFSNYEVFCKSEVYVWGSNANHNLGMEVLESRAQRDTFDCFGSDPAQNEQVQIYYVSMSENHTLFLARGGKVYSCGRGLGGRLGLGTEENRPEPKPIPCFETTHKCVAVATGADHSLFLTESKMIFSCGRNEYGQLGCSLDTTDRVLTPREIQVGQGRGFNSIEGIACGPFHSIIYSSSVMYTFGRNEGQLGHKRGEEVIKEPKSEHPRECCDCNQEPDEENDGSHVTQSTMKKDMAFLLENAEELSPDITLIVEGKRFPAHRLILMERCEYFRNLSEMNSKADIVLDGMSHQIFPHILRYVYMGDWSTDPSRQAKEFAEKLHLMQLIKYLAAWELSDFSVVQPAPDVLLDPPRSGWFVHGAWSSLADITLLSRDGKEFPCHKCILMARSEYFRVMFDSTWLEGQGKEKVSLAIAADVIQVVLDYLYGDSHVSVSETNNSTFISQVLVAADQLLLNQLKASGRK
ncbi:unnamed protein product [Darwinula stevensoni]|uniref:BTB domain-containing protein n=1 Tax=Darwinula stevensoni TaxID=69355 RepID=A0A7R8XE79_9CRUS|nr:unnamed protein product [Darwinula stevensoni]CAG0893787.1 unnamed protein product [Darwinula stevensoni]